MLIIKVATSKIAGKIINCNSKKHIMGSRDTARINKLSPRIQIFLYSKRRNCSHKITKISRKKALSLQMRTHLWANLREPPFSRISRTISISIIIDREGLQGKSLCLLTRATLSRTTRQAITSSIACSLTNLGSLNKLYYRNMNRYRDR